ncbi:MAG TPA: O-antigen ligase family protein [Caulobacteraceae bacterium]|jgi:O-antigen ligase
MSFAPVAYARAPAAPARSTVLEAAETLFVLGALFLMSNALLTPLFAGPDVADEPGWMRLMWLPVYGGLAAFACLRAGRMSSVWPAALLTLPLVMLAFASAEGSLMPDVSTRRAVAFSFTTLFGFYLAARFEWRALVEVLATLYFALAVGSAVAALAFPGFGVDGSVHPGAWKGLWLEKNALGAAMARGTLACACAAILAPQRRMIWSGAALLCAGLVLASTSTTGLLGLLLALACLAGIRLLRSGGAGAVLALWLGLVGVTVVAAVMLLAPELFFGLVGKDATLTGRTDIWEAAMRRVAAEPGGHGYAAFWSAEGGPAEYIRIEADWPVPNAHNGWLELLLWFGWAGLAVFAVHYVVSLLSVSARVWSRDGGAYFALPTILLFLLFSISESTIMQWNNLSWVLYVAVLAKALQVATGPERRTSAAP